MAEEEKKESVTAQSASAPSGNAELKESQALIDLQNKVTRLSKENADLKEAKREFYDKVLNDNQPQVAEEKHRPISEIRADLIKASQSGASNLEYCKLAVELDDETRRVDGESVFLPKGHSITPTVDEYSRADKMNAVLKECISKAEGNPDRFNAELKSHMR